MRRLGTCLLLVLCVAVWHAHAQEAKGNHDVHHVTIYYEKGRFGGWPANHGIWIWGNEILVGLSVGYYKDLGPTMHHIDRERPERCYLARSLDGGETWTLEYPPGKGYLVPSGEWLHGTEDPDLPIPPLKDCPGGIDFTHPDFALTARMQSKDAGNSIFWYSYDRGHTWEGPFRLPNYGRPGTAARTDYIVNGKHDCMLFLTAAKPDGEEGQTFCVRTTDGGKRFNFVSWIGPEPEGFSIMPASVRINDHEILVAVRRREGPKRWIGAYISEDNGKTWSSLPDPVADCGEGNPPALIKLRDGRLCLCYGYRAAPWSINAKLSSDNGRTWSDPIVLRDDGVDRDIGYCRAVQRPDGKVVTIYYYDDKETGPERYIAATIWDPSEY